MGLYQLTAAITHSPVGYLKKISEMFGYAESTPIRHQDNGGDQVPKDNPYVQPPPHQRPTRHMRAVPRRWHHRRIPEPR